jgi:ElaB/YqjD/DUF883 family membrane-anchored ribosome-binding protein
MLELESTVAEVEQSHDQAEASPPTGWDNVEAVEVGIRSAVQSATNAVRDSAAGVEETVQAVQAASLGVIEKVRRAFDLSAHFRRHPWLTVGGALLVGVVLGQLAGRSPPSAARE